MKIETAATQKPTVTQSQTSQAQSTHFATVLEKALKPKPTPTYEAQPAALTRLIKPRSHLQLTSLNPVSGPPSPKPAALEKIGDARILPFALSTSR